MLVAFTACEQEPIDMNGYVPSALSIQYNGTGALVGDKLDPADFSGVVTYKNGKTAPYTGTYSFEDSSTEAYKNGLNVISASIVSEVGASSASVAAATCYVPAYIPEEIIVDVTNAATEVEVSKSVPVTGLAVTAKYNGGQEMTLDASYINATATTTSADEDVKVTVAIADGTLALDRGVLSLHVGRCLQGGVAVGDEVGERKPRDVEQRLLRLP